jgi:hypothetical protein
LFKAQLAAVPKEYLDEEWFEGTECYLRAYPRWNYRFREVQVNSTDPAVSFLVLRRGMREADYAVFEITCSSPASATDLAQP